MNNSNDNVWQPGNQPNPYQRSEGMFTPVPNNQPFGQQPQMNPNGFQNAPMEQPFGQPQTDMNTGGFQPAPNNQTFEQPQAQMNAEGFQTASNGQTFGQPEAQVNTGGFQSIPNNQTFDQSQAQMNMGEFQSTPNDQFFGQSNSEINTEGFQSATNEQTFGQPEAEMNTGGFIPQEPMAPSEPTAAQEDADKVKVEEQEQITTFSEKTGINPTILKIVSSLSIISILSLLILFLLQNGSFISLFSFNEIDVLWANRVYSKAIPYILSIFTIVILLMRFAKAKQQRQVITWGLIGLGTLGVIQNIYFSMDLFNIISISGLLGFLNGGITVTFIFQILVYIGSWATSIAFIMLGLSAKKYYYTEEGTQASVTFEKKANLYGTIASVGLLTNLLTVIFGILTLTGVIDLGLELSLNELQVIPVIQSILTLLAIVAAIFCFTKFLGDTKKNYVWPLVVTIIFSTIIFVSQLIVIYNYIRSQEAISDVLLLMDLFSVPVVLINIQLIITFVIGIVLGGLCYASVAIVLQIMKAEAPQMEAPVDPFGPQEPNEFDGFNPAPINDQAMDTNQFPNSNQPMQNQVISENQEIPENQGMPIFVQQAEQVGEMEANVSNGQDSQVQNS